METTYPASFGTWLKAARAARGWTQDDLAVQADCSVESIRRFEREQGKPSKHSAGLIAATFRIPANEQAAFVGWARQLPHALLPPSALAIAHPATGGVGRPFAIPAPPTPLIGRE